MCHGFDLNQSQSCLLPHRPSPGQSGPSSGPGQSCHQRSRDQHPHRATPTSSSKYCMNNTPRVSCSELTAADRDRCSTPARRPDTTRGPGTAVLTSNMPSVSHEQGAGVPEVRPTGLWEMLWWMVWKVLLDRSLSRGCCGTSLLRLRRYCGGYYGM